ncbi:MAG: DNA repair protein RecO [Gammaproteobacteria bacterium]|jgi:DNA repair protein RecO (recombination protein O)
MSNRVVLQPAYVLHLKPYRDTSALVELITPEHGRMGLVARGIKGPTSKLRSVVQPFSPILVSWSGRGELPSLTGAEPQGRALLLKAEALACGLYMNELTMRLTHRAEPQIELFSVYDVSLRQLCTPQQCEWAGLHLQQVLRQFEIKLLQCLGYGLLLGEEAGNAKGKKVRSDLSYDFQLEIGPVVLDDPHQEIFGIKVSGKTLLALANNRLHEYRTEMDIYKEAKHLLRFVLDRYLGNKPLLSRQLLRRKTALPESRE